MRPTAFLSTHPITHPDPHSPTHPSSLLSFCVVDEADSILIDEARTPLIISRKVSGNDDDDEFTSLNMD